MRIFLSRNNQYHYENIKVKIISFLLVFLVTTLSTHPNEQIAWKGKIKIKNGCKIVVNPHEPLCGQLKLELKKDLIIGNPKDKNTTFFGAITVNVDQKGNIYILDWVNKRIQKFDKNGKFIQSIGREGQGPGEFQSPGHFFLVNEYEDIFIYDSGRYKIHHFDKNGRFIRPYHLSFPIESFALTSENNFLINSRVFSREGGVEAVHLINQKGNVLKTIATFPNVELEAWFGQKARFTAVFPELHLYPFKKDSAIFGYSAEYKIYRVDSKGNITTIIKKEEPKEKVSRKEKNQVINNLIKMYGRGNKRNEQDIRKRTFFSIYKPFFDRILTDEDGCIFVRRYRVPFTKDKNIIYDFFNEEGKYLYKLGTDKDILFIKNGYLYTSEYDKEEECFKLIRYKIKNWSRIKKNLIPSQ
ncbi:6-bladed beta-propeller [Candidatus Aminicenantes bacterium AH-873-B07]|nr:6-bladed beta-propeller [Candidatus Aminicenantes bacterium AH-873-B07]